MSLSVAQSLLCNFQSLGRHCVTFSHSVVTFSHYNHNKRTGNCVTFSHLIVTVSLLVTKPSLCHFQSLSHLCHFHSVVTVSLSVTQSSLSHFQSLCHCVTFRHSVVTVSLSVTQSSLRHFQSLSRHCVTFSHSVVTVSLSVIQSSLCHFQSLSRHCVTLSLSRHRVTFSVPLASAAADRGDGAGSVRPECLQLQPGGRTKRDSAGSSRRRHAAACSRGVGRSERGQRSRAAGRVAGLQRRQFHAGNSLHWRRCQFYCLHVRDDRREVRLAKRNEYSLSPTTALLV